MHEILKILVIAACYRIQCLIRIGGGVKIGIQRALHQLHKGILCRKLSGTAKHRMLYNMWHTGRILRWSTESNGEYFVVVLIAQKENSRPAFLMPECQCKAVDLRNCCGLLQCICVRYFYLLYAFNL